jgi:hypothetical protein
LAVVQKIMKFLASMEFQVSLSRTQKPVIRNSQEDDYETCCLCLLGRLLFTPMRETAGFTDMTVHIYQTAWHNFPKEQLSSKSSHHPEFTNVNDIKNAIQIN